MGKDGTRAFQAEGKCFSRGNEENEVSRVGFRARYHGKLEKTKIHVLIFECAIEGKRNF